MIKILRRSRSAPYGHTVTVIDPVLCRVIRSWDGTCSVVAGVDGEGVLCAEGCCMM